MFLFFKLVSLYIFYFCQIISLEIERELEDRHHDFCLLCYPWGNKCQGLHTGITPSVMTGKDHFSNCKFGLWKSCYPPDLLPQIWINGTTGKGSPSVLLLTPCQSQAGMVSRLPAHTGALLEQHQLLLVAC